MKQLVILYLFYLNISEISAVFISYTTKGVKCMTSCEKYSNYNFCYLGWGANNWDYCTPGKEESLQYYTSLYKGNNPKCTSLCGTFNYNYNWCFTGANGAWDYCTEKQGYSAVNMMKCIGECKRDGESEYSCKTGRRFTPDIVVAENPGIPLHVDLYDYCSPDPVDLNDFKEISNIILTHPGEYKSSGFNFLEHCLRTKRLSGNVIRTVGVDALAARYERQHQSTAINETNIAVTSFTESNAPPLPNHYNQRITLVVRATIYNRHLNNQRDQIPNYITQRMSNMDALPDDERGHLLAASLGGPTHDFNFAPQTTRVNRASGGDSYWFMIEGDIRRFLQNNPGGYVQWTLVIAYGNLDTSRRPTGFALRFRQYNANGVLVHDSGDCYFSNDPNGPCDIV